jgi:hypothetical protein
LSGVLALSPRQSVLRSNKKNRNVALPELEQEAEKGREGATLPVVDLRSTTYPFFEGGASKKGPPREERLIICRSSLREF